MAFRKNRKVDDGRLIILNNLGIPLKNIAQEMRCHPSTITLRLQALGISPVDTRRSFSEDLQSDLTSQEQEWLSNQMKSGMNIKRFMVNLVKTAYKNRSQP